MHTEQQKPKVAPRTTGTTGKSILEIAPMSLEQAERTIWQVRRGPARGRVATMSELYKDGDLDIEDFAWIILHWWSDTEKKRAAYTLLRHYLGQPQTLQTALRHGPQVFGGSKYLEEQQYENQIQAVLSASWGLAGGGLILLGLIWSSAERILQGHPWQVTVVAALILVLLLIVPIALYSKHEFRKAMEKSRDYRLGREGEEWVVDRTRVMLDSRWTVFRNLTLPNRNADCDLVLIGPPGIYVLEVKAYRGNIRVQDGVWEEQTRGKWRSMSKNPQAQATGSAVGLSDWIKRHGVVQYVDKALVLTEPQPSTNFTTSKVPVWLHYDVDQQLTALNHKAPSLSDEELERIVEIVQIAGDAKS